MRLEGIHHITAITGDAPGNVDFYARVLGLRLVKKTVNQDDPTVYHLFYADEHGSARRRHHVLRVPGRATRTRRRGHGAPRRLARRLRGGARLLGGAARLPKASRCRAPRAACASPTPRASTSSSSSRRPDEPLVAEFPEIPPEHALQGFHGVRAFTADARPEPPASSRTGSRSSRRGDGVGGPRREARLVLRLRRRRPIAASRAPARSTTSRGRRRWRSTRPGGSARRQRAPRRRR